MELNNIRSTFLEFFKKNDHALVHSSPLIPHNDPTLMFTNAGMNQFKNYFTGVEKPSYLRAASSQKCVRAGGKHNDLENVGYTARHHTFFEMLGNFSFGDYFKEKAIEMAWKCLTQEFSLDKNRLYITVYHTDDEAYFIWKKLTGFGDDKIIRISTNDNFWAMGEVGPCGPCSEIYFDHGDKISGGLPGTPEEGGDRYVEIWNLVFMQFEDQVGGKRVNLPKPSIDTGMGLERITAVLQGKHNNYDIDLFQNIIEASKHISGNEKDITSHRVIADHLRSSCFLIADSVMPSNEGRGYVLRRIMRRAMRHVNLLGCKETMLYKLVPTLVSEMGDAFPELKRAEAVITSTLKMEEEKFAEAVDKGMKLLNEASTNLKDGDILDGKTAFKLYDTYGFPLDLTSDILRAKNVAVDQEGFDQEMKEQKIRAKAAWKGSGEKATDEVWFEIHEEVGATDFLGYVTDKAEAVIKAIVRDGKIVQSAKKSEEVIIVLNQTPFYGESGGQVGDSGWINDNEVLDTQKYIKGIFGHRVKFNNEIKVGDAVVAVIDSERRAKIKANHSATHLLHKALREILGSHVTQKGSLVEADRLRFDFSHNKAVTAEEIEAIENLVYKMILANNGVDTEVMTPEKAIAKGAMALFGEKYGDEVRVVEMSESLELCGGTHVRSTGDIGFFKITLEQAISSGVRRIEAVTGIGAFEYVKNKDKILTELLSTVKCAEPDLINRVKSLLSDKKKLEDEIVNLRTKLALTNKPQIEQVNGVSVLSLKLNNIPQQDLKIINDYLRKQYSPGIVVLFSVVNAKLAVVVSVSNELISKYNANELVKQIAPIIKGNGGGKADYAQAGGEEIGAIDMAYENLKKVI
jgi:alanyl-tRNA synthetase